MKHASSMPHGTRFGSKDNHVALLGVLLFQCSLHAILVHSACSNHLLEAPQPLLLGQVPITLVDFVASFGGSLLSHACITLLKRTVSI